MKATPPKTEELVRADYIQGRLTYQEIADKHGLGSSKTVDRLIQSRGWAREKEAFQLLLRARTEDAILKDAEEAARVAACHARKTLIEAGNACALLLGAIVKESRKGQDGGPAGEPDAKTVLLWAQTVDRLDAIMTRQKDWLRLEPPRDLAAAPDEDLDVVWTGPVKPAGALRDSREDSGGGIDSGF